MTGSPRRQLCSPGAAIGSLAFVLAGGEVPPLPGRLLAFLSPTELLRPRNAGEAAGFSPETGGPRASFPGPQPQLPLPAVPRSVIGAKRGHPGADSGFGPDGQQRPRKGETKHPPTNSTAGKEAWHKVPEREAAALPARNPRLFTEQGSQGFLWHGPGPGDFHRQQTVCQAPLWACAVVTRLLSQRAQRGVGT